MQLGQTVLLFHEAASPRRDLTSRVDMLNKSSPEDRSAILKSIPSDEGSRVLKAPDAARRLAARTADEPVGHVPGNPGDQQHPRHRCLIPQILELVFESIGADRGAILLKDESGRLVPKAVRWRVEAEPDERMTISQTIVDYVLEKGEGSHHHRCPDRQAVQPRAVDRRLPDPPGDLRADSGKAYHSRGPLCRHPGRRRCERSRRRQALSSAAASAKSSSRSWSRSGTRPGWRSKTQSFTTTRSRPNDLAAVGQTIATLSHHIKNILQGIRGGSSLIDLGLKDKDELIVRRGWTIVEKNQTKIYNLVMDMLSFSKDREPDLELADLNETDRRRLRAHALPRGRAGSRADSGTRATVLPRIMIDTDGIHRAVLNIVTNAIDACEGS